MKQSQINAFNILNNVSEDTTADLLEKAMGHKYYKREGTPGNYKYYYTEEQYNKEKKGEKEDIGKKLEATTSIIEYRRHLIDYGTKNGDKDLVEYAKNASVSALERRMKSEKTEEQFQDRSFSIKIGQDLKVPSSLTSDPSGKKGQFGKVTSIEDDIITLKFSDGKTGRYDRSIW